MRALITGIMGQDGYYLSQFLLDKGYEVIGTRRGTSEKAEEPPGVRVVFGDVTDCSVMVRLCKHYRPDEFYNLAALTHVGDSFNAAAAYFHNNAIGTANCLEAAKTIDCKFYQASTSEIFGDSPSPQNEGTAMRPRSPYGVAKLAAYWMTRNCRAAGMYAVNGILFNHESPKRGGDFVTQKVCRGVAEIVQGRAKKLCLGNLNATRDWGHAADFVRGMWMMMQQPKPGDYVLATGIDRTVRELCNVAFGHVGLDYRQYVVSTPENFRPLEVEHLCGDPSRMMALGWRPQITFDEMIAEMVDMALGCSRAMEKAA